MCRLLHLQRVWAVETILKVRSAQGVSATELLVGGPSRTVPWESHGLYLSRCGRIRWVWRLALGKLAHCYPKQYSKFVASLSYLRICLEKGRKEEEEEEE